MKSIEQELAGLASQPPSHLESVTVFTAGAADYVAETESPIGPVWVAWSREGITALSPMSHVPTYESFSEHHRRTVYGSPGIPETLGAAIHNTFTTGDGSELVFDLSRLTAFQQQVLDTCATIPPGTVRPYGWVAETMHSPGATRAVGTALARNPIPLLIPCHRVVRADGTIGQYAFGAEMKRELLIREGAVLL